MAKREFEGEPLDDEPFDDELYEDDGVREDRELFLQIQIDKQEELAAKYERLADMARDDVDVACRRDDRLTALRRGRDANAALDRSLLCRERAAHAKRELYELIRKLRADSHGCGEDESDEN